MLSTDRCRGGARHGAPGPARRRRWHRRRRRRQLWREPPHREIFFNPLERPYWLFSIV